VHDLVRLYAREQVPSDSGRESPPLRRFLDHYLHTAHAAELLLSPQREPLTLGRTAPGVVVPDLPDTDAALAWFSAELPALVAAVVPAGAAGRDAHAHRLAWTLATFCGHRGRWREWVLAQHVAVASARHCGDAAALAEALRLLGQAYATGHQFEQARYNYLLALDAFTRTGDLVGRAHVHFDLALLMDRQGRPAEAAPYAQRSLEDFRAAGTDHGVAVALNAVGWYHCELGDYRRGIDCCRQALSVAQRSTASTASPTRWTVSATPTTTSVATPRPSTTIAARSPCCARWATEPAVRSRWTTSGTATRRPGTSCGHG